MPICTFKISRRIAQNNKALFAFFLGHPIQKMPFFNEIKEKVLSAVVYLLRNDSDLLDNNVNERSVSHKLAEYLQQQFPEWHVDCEYNRMRGDVKRANNIPDESGQVKRREVLPDIIIHKRNTELNLLAIEIKKAGSREQLSKDRAKLTAFTKSDGEYRYNFGLLILFQGTEEPQLTWYRDGRTV